MHAIHVEMISEVLTMTGPTGEFKEVFEVRIEDAGGNLIGYATTASEIAKLQKSSYRLVPTKTSEVLPDGSIGSVICGYCS